MEKPISALLGGGGMLERPHENELLRWQLSGARREESHDDKTKK